MQQQTVEEYVKSINDLPALPEIARKIIAATDEPKVDVGLVSDLISMDPSITVKVLKLINSGYYTMRKEVISIRQAVILLGIEQVRNLVITMLTVNHFSEKPDFQIRLNDFWNHSLSVATIAQGLGDRLGFKNTADLYLAALLHDIGKIVIQIYYPHHMDRIIGICKIKKCSMYEAEKRLLGFSHSQIGACVTKYWLFPEHIQNAILYHHDSANSDEPLFTAILEFADNLTKARLYAVYGDQFIDFILDELPCWQTICKESGKQDMDWERLLLELDDDIERARELVKQARDS